MKISKYDLCDKCRNLKWHDSTFGESIDEALANRGGSIKPSGLYAHSNGYKSKPRVKWWMQSMHK